MEYIRVTKENLEQEHICCAISNNKDVQVSSKKAWLAERFDEGLVFLKSVERGKCFIEYIPVENAWNPIVADNYMYIDCLWVSGSFKGHGYSNDLREERFVHPLVGKEEALFGRSEILGPQGIQGMRRGRQRHPTLVSSFFGRCTNSPIQGMCQASEDSRTWICVVLHQPVPV